VKDALGALHEDWRGRKQAIADLASVQGGKRAVTAERLVELIQAESLDLGVLNAALQTLIELGPAALPRLQPLMDDDSPEVRQSAAVVLGQLEAPLGVPRLLTMLEDADPNVRYHAIEGLGQQGALVAVPQLLELATSGDAFLGFAALASLGNIQDPSALPELVELLADPMLADAAAEALGRIGHKLAWRPLLAVLAEVEEAGQALESLVHANADLQVHLTPAQREILRSRHHFGVLEREGVLPAEQLFSSVSELLECLAQGAQQPTLRWALEHENSEVRLAAAEKLASTQTLLELLPEYPERAARALADAGHRQALPPLVQHLGHPGARIRHQLVAEGLRLGTPISELEAALKSPDAGLRGAAARWLVAAGAFPLDRLKAWLAEEKDERVRTEVLEVLPVSAEGLAVLQAAAAELVLFNRLLARWPREQGLPLLQRRPDLWSCVYLCRTLSQWKAQPEWLVEMLDDLRPPVRAEAAKALARVDPAAAAQRLPMLLLDAELDVAEAALLALGDMHCWDPVLQSLEEPRLRATARTALAASQDPAHLALLPVGSLLESHNPIAFELLLPRLEQLTRPQIERLQRAICSLGWTPRSLPSTGRRLLPMVLDGFESDPDPWVRRAALLRNSEQLAERASADPDDTIRHFATRVLS